MTLERRIWRLANLLLVLLVVLSTRLVYWQLVRGNALQPVVLDPAQLAQNPGPTPTTNPSEPAAESPGGGLQELPQPVIQRTEDLLRKITRGTVIDRSGRRLAYDTTVPGGDKVRYYTEPSLAPVLGYVSGLRTGATGLELTYNATLLGLDRPDVTIDQILHQPIVGSELELTIDTRIQRAAEDALSNKAGAILVFDAHSGAILAMASSPHINPNRIQDPGYLQELQASCNGAPQCQAPFLNRATQALYPPGSTFKTVTLIAALDSGQVTPDTIFDFGKPVNGPNGPYYVYRVGGGIIPDPNHVESRLPLDLAYAKSANAAFARIGDEMDPATFVSYGERFGFSQPPEDQPDFELSYSPSQLANNVQDLYSNDLLRAATAIGQGELLTSPLSMGMVALAVMNDGNLPVPYLVQSVRDPQGRVLVQAPARHVERNLMKPGTARLVRQMMITVVQQGSGKRASVPGLTIGGKTGTAQVGGASAPHAWFLGFAQKEDQAVVIVVLVENGGEGSQTAAPVFAQMANVALLQTGEPPEEPAPPPAQPSESEASQPTPAPPQANVPAPEIAHDVNKTDTTEGGQGTCPGPFTGPLGTGVFLWPTTFHTRSGTNFKAGHPGIDLGAPSGSPVFAADTGVVVYAGWANNYGNTIIIDHQNGYRTLYAHLSQISTACGAAVEQGQVIALSGNTGKSSGPHLHFEVRVPGGWIDPKNVLPPS